MGVTTYNRPGFTYLGIDTEDTRLDANSQRVFSILLVSKMSAFVT